MLRDLSELQVRLLTTDRISETLEEIYGPGGTILEVLSTHAKIDGTIERVARFRVRKSSRVVLVGRSKMFVEPLRAELDARWEGFLAALETGGSLGCVLGEALGTRMRSIDRGLNLVDPARHCRARDLVEWFEHRGGAIVERSRRILAEPARPLVDLDEYLAIEGSGA
jgi:hypothetical protein